MIFPHTTRISLLAVALVLPAAVGAQELETTIMPPERPYPYVIHDRQPGMGAEEAVVHFQERGDVELLPEVTSISVQAPDGRTFAFDFPQSYTAAGVGLHTRMGNDPYTSYTINLATDVLDGRVVGISRAIRAPVADLPDAAALQAQLEDLYGPPSKTALEGGYVITYAWSEDGFIPDLDAQEERVVEWETQHGQSSRRYRPCLGARNLDYRFEQFRAPVMPDCVAVFTVSVSETPPNRRVTFSLIDFDLLRQSHTETDRQIMDYLLSEPEASDFDL